MTATRKANLGLFEGWEVGELGWGPGMSDNLRRLDLMVVARVQSLGLNDPPPLPFDGDAYIVGAAPTGAWVGHAQKLARWYETGAVWEFVTAKSGWVIFVADVTTHYQFSGFVWNSFKTVLGSDVFDAYSFFPSSPDSSILLMRVPLLRAVVFPANFVGSRGTATVSATASANFSIQKNGVAVGTANFAAAASSATFTSVGGLAITFASGDILSIVSPATPDASLTNIGFGLTGTR